MRRAVSQTTDNTTHLLQDKLLSMGEQRYPVNIQLLGVMQKQVAKVRRFLFSHFAFVFIKLQVTLHFKVSLSPNYKLKN